MDDDEQELTALSDDLVADDVALLEANDQTIQFDKQQNVSDQPASKTELICFFLFGVFNNFSYIIMLR